MLHVHSYNMGMSAGLAWKASGNEYVSWRDAKEGTPFGDMVMQTLLLTEKFDIFLPSSWMEGFYNAYHRPYFINW